MIPSGTLEANTWYVHTKEKRWGNVKPGENKTKRGDRAESGELDIHDISGVDGTTCGWEAATQASDCMRRLAIRNKRGD